MSTTKKVPKTNISFIDFFVNLGFGIYLMFLGFFIALRSTGGIWKEHQNFGVWRRIKKTLTGSSERASEVVSEYYPKGRKNPIFQRSMFVFFMTILTIIAFLRETATTQAKVFFILDLTIRICIFSMMAIALNTQTGMTGIVNFGVVFFMGVGAVTTAVLTTKLGFSPIIAMFIGMAISALIGFLLAYPSLRLRSDYFAIITLALGEVLRIILAAEPFFQTKNQFGTYSQGITNIPRPFESFIGTGIQYFMFLTLFSISLLILISFIVNRLMYSPYGRVLRTIREDEPVTSSYGYNVLRYKASILAIGGALFAIPGSILVWHQRSIAPGTINVLVTFYVWGAFIIGGKGNNKGMIVGASLVILTRNFVRQLGTVNRDESFILRTIDGIFEFIVVDIGGTIFGRNTWSNTFQSLDDVVVDLVFTQILIIGLIIILSMRYFEEGLIPELPYVIDRDFVESEREKLEVTDTPSSSNGDNQEYNREPEELLKSDPKGGN